MGDQTRVPVRPTDVLDVEFPYPPCPHCHDDLDHDEGWWCNNCHILWPPNGDGRKAYLETECCDEHLPSDDVIPAPASGDSS